MLRAFEVLTALAQELHLEGPGADPQVCELGNTTIDEVLSWIVRAKPDLSFDDVLRSDTQELDQAFVSIRTANLRGWLYGRLHNEHQALESADATAAIGVSHLGRLKELQTQLTAVATELQKAHERGISVLPAAVSLYHRLCNRVMGLLSDDPALPEVQVLAPQLQDNTSVVYLRVVASQLARWLLAAIRWIERGKEDAGCDEATSRLGNYL